MGIIQMITIILALALLGFYVKGKIEAMLTMKEIKKEMIDDEQAKREVEDMSGKFAFACLVFGLFVITMFIRTENLAWLVGSGSFVVYVAILVKSEGKKRNVLLGIFLIPFLVFGAYSWWAFQQVYSENVMYVTRRPIYHRVFHIDEFREDFRVRVIDSHRLPYGTNQSDRHAVVHNRNTGAILVIDMTTGRELMNFQPVENSRHRRTYEVVLVGDGTVRVSRSIREIDGVRRDNQMSLLDIATGQELLSIESVQLGGQLESVLNVVAVYNGLAIVGRPWSREYGVIELESGEITVPIIYCEVVFIYDQLVRVGVEERRLWVYGIIDGVTGEEVRPIIYERIVGSSEVGSSHIFLRDENQTTLVDFATGEEVIDLSQFEFERMDVWRHGYGLIVAVDRPEWVFDGPRLIEIESANVIIPKGTFQGIEILNRNAVLSREYFFHRDGGDRPMVINVHTGEEIIPRGRYEDLGRGNWNYYAGLLLVSDGDRQAIVSVITGEYILPFDTYDRIGQLLPGGYITVREGDYWKIVNVMP